MPERRETEDPTFKRVVGYFLGHEKPTSDAKPKPRNRKPAAKKSPSTAFPTHRASNSSPR